jgi:hypothetical protein
VKLRRKKAEEPSSRRQRLNNAASEDRMQVSSTFSYRARRSEDNINLGRQNTDKPPVSALKTTYFWLERSGLIILLIAVVASLINVLSLSSSAEILPASQGENISSQQKAAYQVEADKLLASNATDHNKITIDVNKLSAQMLSSFPNLGTVSVTIPLIAHRPLIYVSPVQPSLILTAPNGAFALDDSGKAVFKAATPQALNMPKLSVLTDQNNLPVQLNHQALPSNYVSFIQTVKIDLSSKGYDISTMVLPAQTNELDVSLAGQSYFVKFNLEGNDPRQQAGTFLATITSLKSQNITPTKYVDVRVDGRAYYI